MEDIEQYLYEGNSEEKIDMWLNSQSGKFYDALKKIGEKYGKEVKVDPQSIMKRKEIYSLGDEKVALERHIDGGTVGVDDGTLQTYVKLGTMVAYPWFKEALDISNIGYQTINEVRLGHAIIGGGISNEVKFNYNYIANAIEYKLPLSDSEVKNKIISLIKDAITPFLGENYSVKIEDDIYIVPSNNEAKKNMLEHGDIFMSMIHEMTQDVIIGKIQEGMKGIKKQYIEKYKNSQQENTENINTLKKEL
ncbi:MAG: hypothetical protein NT085_03565 [candidate division SR1 bacterium]|nr:hypothetical protein [candidate division SR1 bacterium]